MSYFNLSNGQAPVANTEFDMGGGDIAPIPKGTVVRAIAEQVKWDSFNGEPDYISITWQVQLPVEFKNRKVFQKIRVEDSDPAKADKAIMMLGAILANANSSFEDLGQGKPSSDRLNQLLTFKPMSLKLAVWEIEKDGEKKTGNWVQSVSASQSQSSGAKQQVVVEDDLPF